METITVFDTSFAKAFDRDEFQALLSLEKALSDVANEYGFADDKTIEKYCEAHPDIYQFNISIGTLRKYVKKKNYIIYQNAPFILKGMKVDEYFSLLEKLEKLLATDTSDSSIAPSNCAADNDLLKNNALITEYSNFYSSNKELKQISVRCSKKIWERFNALCEELPFFEKSHLLGYVLKKGLDSFKNN